MGFVEGCENDAEVVRLVIEALQRELDAVGGPEDARAEATLHYLVGIATARGSSSQTPRECPRPTHDGAVTPRCIRFGVVREGTSGNRRSLLGWILPRSLLRRAAVGSVSLRRPRPSASLSDKRSVAGAQRRPIGRHPASKVVMVTGHIPYSGVEEREGRTW